MFGLFRSTPYVDPLLGRLSRSRGRWRGSAALAGKVVPLALVGSREAPGADALSTARELADVWAHNQGPIERALFAHYEPYREAVACGELAPPAAQVVVSSSGDVWKHVEVQSASVTLLDGSLVAGVALAVAWDEEHTVGARFSDGQFTELNGSIIPE